MLASSTLINICQAWQSRLRVETNQWFIGIVWWLRNEEYSTVLSVISSCSSDSNVCNSQTVMRAYSCMLKMAGRMFFSLLHEENSANDVALLLDINNSKRHCKTDKTGSRIRDKSLDWVNICWTLLKMEISGDIHIPNWGWRLCSGPHLARKMCFWLGYSPGTPDLPVHCSGSGTTIIDNAGLMGTVEIRARRMRGSLGSQPGVHPGDWVMGNLGYWDL